MAEPLIVAVVGVCASGKTSLVKQLQNNGIDAYNVAQEHSGIPRLWRRRCPDVLVLLDVNLAQARQRRNVPWGEERLTVQRQRLEDARNHADIVIQTDGLTIEEVAQKVVEYIKRGISNVINHCT